MRIRKRRLPLSFSSLPLSNPLHAHAPPLPLSDPPNLHPSGSDFATHQTNGLEKEEQEDDGDNTRERSVFDAETSNGVLPQSTSSPQVVCRWGEREKAFPLKKRRGSFERPSDDHNNNEDEEEDQKKTMKTKMSKKCTLPQKQEQEEDQSKMGLNLAGKKKSRGSTLMEGSRCSRVNGRGWRCCQQTLVGYSLCEHHLGKSRLRSMNSVRRRSLAATAPKNLIIVKKEDSKKPSRSPRPPLTLTSKKRTKLRVVKARSISSLLSQPDGLMAVAPPPPLPPTPPDDKIDG